MKNRYWGHFMGQIYTLFQKQLKHPVDVLKLVGFGGPTEALKDKLTNFLFSALT
jgi:hypothetical protein